MHLSKENTVKAGAWAYRWKNTCVKLWLLQFAVTMASILAWNPLPGQDSSLMNLTMQEVLAHNDYQKSDPFQNAYAHRVGIMEADLMLHQDKILVAHDQTEISRGLDLEQLYLIPLREKVKKYGRAYPEDGKSLAIMLDLKNESDKIVTWIIHEIIPKYPELFGMNDSDPIIYLIISGDRPPQTSWMLLPRCIKIDGRLTDDIPVSSRERIHMVSASFTSVISGHLHPDGRLNVEQRQALRKAIDMVHQQNLKIRLWGVPDVFPYWKLLHDIGVDILGCDNLDTLAIYLNR